MQHNIHAVEVIRKCVLKGGGTTGVLYRRARVGGERDREPITQNRRSDYARPWITQGHGPSTQRTRMDNDTSRNKQANMYL